MTVDQFQRTRLLFGDRGLTHLRTSHVAVVGCGAVGSFAAEALARVGVGHITLVDGDSVEHSNINRQLCALYSTVGQNKTTVLANRIHDICPETTVTTYPVFITEATIDDVLSNKPDFVIDAIDTIADKINLILWLQKNHIPFVSSMGAALRTKPEHIHVAPLKKTTVCPLASKVRHLLRQRGGDMTFPCVYSDEPPATGRAPDRQMGSLVTITGMFGLIAANEAIRFMCGK